MTLKELIGSGLFSQDTYIYFEAMHGSFGEVLKFDKVITFGNALQSFSKNVLNREVNFVDAYEYNAILIHFMEE